MSNIAHDAVDAHYPVKMGYKNNGVEVITYKEGGNGMAKICDDLYGEGIVVGSDMIGTVNLNTSMINEYGRIITASTEEKQIKQQCTFCRVKRIVKKSEEFDMCQGCGALEFEEIK